MFVSTAANLSSAPVLRAMIVGGLSDNEPSDMSVRRAIGTIPFRVPDVAAAIEYLFDHDDIGLVILHQKLSHGSGIDAVRLLLGDRSDNTALSVVLAADFLDLGDVAEAIDAGVTAVLPLPATPIRVRETLSRAMAVTAERRRQAAIRARLAKRLFIAESFVACQPHGVLSDGPEITDRLLLDVITLGGDIASGGSASTFLEPVDLVALALDSLAAAGRVAPGVSVALSAPERWILSTSHRSLLGKAARLLTEAAALAAGPTGSLDLKLERQADGHCLLVVRWTERRIHEVGSPPSAEQAGDDIRRFRRDMRLTALRLIAVRTRSGGDLVVEERSPDSWALRLPGFIERSTTGTDRS